MRRGAKLLPCGEEPGNHASAPFVAGCDWQRTERPPMTKKEIAQKISEQSGIPVLVAVEVVQWLFDAIIETLQEEGRIELRNFGVFEVKRRRARKARNPRTGEGVNVPARMVVAFKPGREMEERVSRLK